MSSTSRLVSLTYPIDATILEKISLNRKAIKKVYNMDVIQNDLLKKLPKMDLLVPDAASASNTKSVSSRIRKQLKALDIGIGDPVKITIDPFLLRNCCHWNCTFMRDLFPQDLEVVMGYNVTACPCGTMYYLEFHSVLRTTASNEYLDFTTDFNGEVEKWFVPVFVLNEEHEIADVVKRVRLTGIGNFSNRDVHECVLPRGRLAYHFPGLTSVDVLREQMQALRTEFGKQ